jgi:hypothetical protein
MSSVLYHARTLNNFCPNGASIFSRASTKMMNPAEKKIAFLAFILLVAVFLGALISQFAAIDVTGILLKASDNPYSNRPVMG